VEDPPTGDVAALEEYVAAAVRTGLVGDPDLAGHLVNAAAFEAALPPDGRTLDLGSGAGLPGLLLAHRLPDREFVLLEASARRCRFLEQWAIRLAPRTRVVQGRAEVVARTAEFAGTCAAVVARSFGPPAVTAECGVGFLTLGGVLVVSEPPDTDGSRWPEAGLRRLGLRASGRISADGATVQVIERTEVVGGYPRPDGVPAQRPVF